MLLKSSYIYLYSEDIGHVILLVNWAMCNSFSFFFYGWPCVFLTQKID